LRLGFLLLGHKRISLKKTARKNKKPTNQCLWRVGLGN
jgi:hypothetical protein